MFIPEKTAFVFPGQGSQKIGMGQDLARAYPVAAEVFTLADDLAGFALSKLAWEGPESELNDTINTQPALLTHSSAALAVFQHQFPGFQPAFCAGHSMGELSALVGAGALSFAATFQLARRRGELMKMAGVQSPGGMAAIIALDTTSIEQVCAQASAPGEIVQIANDNCPGQVVISGATPALERACQLAQQAGARKVTVLAVSIAAHSPLMTLAQEDFQQAVNAAPIQDPGIEVVGNVTARPLDSAEAIRQDLQMQLTSRVRWTESIQFMLAHGVETFIELGSGSVLAGLIKRINRDVANLSLGTPEDFDKLARGEV